MNLFAFTQFACLLAGLLGAFNGTRSVSPPIWMSLIVGLVSALGPYIAIGGLAIWLGRFSTRAAAFKVDLRSKLASWAFVSLMAGAPIVAFEFAVHASAWLAA